MNPVMISLPIMTMGKTDDEAAALKNKIKSVMKKPFDFVKAEFTRIADEEYHAKKEERHAAAMKFLDKNGDGRLQLTEFLAAFLLEGDDSQQLNAALGVNMKAHLPAIMPKMEEILRSSMQEVGIS